MLDTNTVLSALLFEEGRLVWIRTLWEQRRLTPLCSDVTADEQLRVLAYPKFRLDEGEIRVVFSAYLFYAEVVSTQKVSTKALPRCRDYEDQKFLELALAGEAEVLVTGDRDLLSLAENVPFDIETPSKFRERFV